VTSPAILRLGSVCAAAFAGTFVWVTASRARYPDPSSLARTLLDPTVQATMSRWKSSTLRLIVHAEEKIFGAGSRPSPPASRDPRRDT
jgi:hypothetical protein